MIKIISLVFLVLIVGCEEKEIFIKKGNSILIDTSGLEIEKADELTWVVGRNRIKQKVSKGFIVKFQLPKLKEENFRELYEKNKIDSWLVKITKSTSSNSNNSLGMYVVPFRVRTDKGMRFSHGGLSQFMVYYAAASMSERFRRFPCPAFDHRFRIDDLDIRSNPARSEQSLLLAQRDRGLTGKFETAGFIPLHFNGGMSLEGEYQISIALFNSQFNILYSEFAPLADKIIVRSEDTIAIQGCENFQIPEAGELPGIKDIRWNK